MIGIAIGFGCGEGLRRIAARAVDGAEDGESGQMAGGKVAGFQGLGTAEQLLSAAILAGIARLAGGGEQLGRALERGIGGAQVVFGEGVELVEDPGRRGEVRAGLDPLGAGPE